jgi:uncharacterized membrane protein
MSNLVLDLVLVVVLIVGSMVEFFVFNEESLLALCFILFILFAYIYLRDSITSGLSSRAVTLEQSLSEAVVSSTASIDDKLFVQKECLELKSSLIKAVCQLDKKDLLDKKAVFFNS